MKGFFHSVRLNEERCKGCVNCIKHCPTEAIRIRNGKAEITEERCIDCGECIRQCANHAKMAVTDKMSALEPFRYNIALPAPSLYAQFPARITEEEIAAALVSIGFDAVFEVAWAAELVSTAIHEFLNNPTRNSGRNHYPCRPRGKRRTYHHVYRRARWLAGHASGLGNRTCAAQYRYRAACYKALTRHHGISGGFWVTPDWLWGLPRVRPLP